jgi:hypothetical protein
VDNGDGVKHPQSGDYAWASIVAGAIIYELNADDLLSVAADRYRIEHKWLVRAVLLAVGAHLGGVLPAWADLFDADNVVHRGVKHCYHLIRP